MQVLIMIVQNTSNSRPRVATSGVTFFRTIEVPLVQHFRVMFTTSSAAGSVCAGGKRRHTRGAAQVPQVLHQLHP